MKVLLVSYYAEAHLHASSAQNVRLLAESLSGRGHEVRVVCAAAAPGRERGNGYETRKLPLAAPSWSSGWRGAWRPDPRVRDLARRDLAEWPPDLLLIGAWKHLTEFGLEARRRGIPTVQVVHDYSLVCLRQWLLDGSGNLCGGPGREKCLECFEKTLGFRSSLRNRLLSLPILPVLAEAVFGAACRADHHLPTAFGEAWSHMAAYRRAITLFIAQAPSVVEVLGAAGVPASRCRLLPQFIGEEKLERYPRPSCPPGSGRPLCLAYVGRWSHEKGPDILLEAFSTARLAIDAELLVVSRNADRSELERRGRIRVVDDARGAEVSRLLAECDLCVVPSRCQELASRVVLEANAQGVPVLVSSTVGNRYLVEDGINGRIFPSGDTAALRSCIEEASAAPGKIREWSSRVAVPVRREEWTAKVLEILEEALRIGPV